MNRRECLVTAVACAPNLVFAFVPSVEVVQTKPRLTALAQCRANKDGATRRQRNVGVGGETVLDLLRDAQERCPWAIWICLHLGKYKPGEESVDGWVDGLWNDPKHSKNMRLFDEDSPMWNK